MTVFFLTIPLMLVGIAIAVVPLVWAMKHHEKWEQSAAPATAQPDESDELVAA